MHINNFSSVYSYIILDSQRMPAKKAKTKPKPKLKAIADGEETQSVLDLVRKYKLPPGQFLVKAGVSEVLIGHPELAVRQLNAVRLESWEVKWRAGEKWHDMTLAAAILLENCEWATAQEKKTFKYALVDGNHRGTSLAAAIKNVLAEPDSAIKLSNMESRIHLGVHSGEMPVGLAHSLARWTNGHQLIAEGQSFIDNLQGMYLVLESIAQTDPKIKKNTFPSYADAEKVLLQRELGTDKNRLKVVYNLLMKMKGCLVSLSTEDKKCMDSLQLLLDLQNPDIHKVAMLVDSDTAATIKKKVHKVGGFITRESQNTQKAFTSYDQAPHF